MDLCRDAAIVQSQSGDLEAADIDALAGRMFKCVACEDDATFQESLPYGRNPFKRRCNCCTASYKVMNNQIQKEKQG